MDERVIITLEDAKIFQNDHLVVSDVNLNVNTGEFIYLIGRVGSGKTSLIKTLNAELSLQEGSGMVAGYDLRKLKRRHIPKLRRNLGVIFQDFKLLTDRTVYDNLLFVLKATGWKNKIAIKDRIDYVLDLVNLKYKAYKKPHQLSGGEQQRVVIARALLNDPDVILADEPTGNLDPDTTDEIMDILFSISANGRAVLMATHNYSTLKKFPARTIKFEKGGITEREFYDEEIDFDLLP
ncbi:MAG: ATP-binding cassette domain-containing protein [Bacteroidales bacterium]|jgi:cell division transport system ATP-binding protein|nr:ATP-binding cassette domain-containing protein [Bacteroidales bacterium]